MQNLALPCMCPEPTCANFHVLNSMLVYIEMGFSGPASGPWSWWKGLQDVYCLVEAIICKRCMVHIQAPCTVNSEIGGLRLCAVFTQMTLSQKLKLPKCMQVLSLDALNLIVCMVCWPLLPGNWYISTFARPPYAFRSRALPLQLSFFFCAPLQVILRRVRPLSNRLK